MTNEEAIEYITERYVTMSMCLTLDECRKHNKAISMAIDALEKQIPKKPYKDNENGVYEKEHCPSCHQSLFPNDHHCECGQAIDWSDDE